MKIDKESLIVWALPTKAATFWRISFNILTDEVVRRNIHIELVQRSKTVECRACTYGWCSFDRALKCAFADKYSEELPQYFVNEIMIARRKHVEWMHDENSTHLYKKENQND